MLLINKRARAHLICIEEDAPSRPTETKPAGSRQMFLLTSNLNPNPNSNPIPKSNPNQVKDASACASVCCPDFSLANQFRRAVVVAAPPMDGLCKCGNIFICQKYGHMSAIPQRRAHATTTVDFMPANLN